MLNQTEMSQIYKKKQKYPHLAKTYLQYGSLSLKDSYFLLPSVQKSSFKKAIITVIVKS